MTCARSHIIFLLYPAENSSLDMSILINQFTINTLLRKKNHPSFKRGGGGVLEAHRLHCYPEEQTSFIKTIISLISTNSNYRKITGCIKCSYSIIIFFVKKYRYIWFLKFVQIFILSPKDSCRTVALRRNFC